MSGDSLFKYNFTNFDISTHLIGELNEDDIKMNKTKILKRVPWEVSILKYKQK